MHRDISIGNVLLTLGESTSINPFSLEDEILKATLPSVEGTSMDMTTALKSLSIQEIAETPRSLAEEIKSLVKALQIEEQCTAFVTDGDMAANWKTYFNDAHNLETRSVSGCPMRFFPSLTFSNSVLRSLCP